jgi:hypothetical protein
LEVGISVLHLKVPSEDINKDFGGECEENEARSRPLEEFAIQHRIVRTNLSVRLLRLWLVDWTPNTHRSGFMQGSPLPISHINLKIEERR